MIQDMSGLHAINPYLPVNQKELLIVFKNHHLFQLEKK